MRLLSLALLNGAIGSGGTLLPFSPPPLGNMSAEMFGAFFLRRRTRTMIYSLYVCVCLFASVPRQLCPRGLAITWCGDVVVYVKDINQPSVPASFSVCPAVSVSCLYGPFICISFHKFSRQLSAFSLCSSGLNSALLVLSTTYLFTKVSLSPSVIFCGWLGLKHQLIN